MTTYQSNKTNTSTGTGKGEGDEPDNNDFTLTINGSIDPGIDGNSNDTFVTPTFNMNDLDIVGKQVIVLLEIDNPMTSGEYSTSSPAAASSFTFDATNYGANDGSTVTLTDARGVSETFTGRNATTVGITNEFLQETSATVTGDNFRDVVNGSALAITVTNNSGVITLIQDDEGLSGNTAVIYTLGFGTLCSTNPSDFSGGNGIDLFAEISPDGDIAHWSSYSDTSNTGISISRNLDLTQAIGTQIIHVFDLRKTQFPYMRIGINSNGRNLGALEFSLGIAYPKTYTTIPDTEWWSEVGERG